MSATLTLMRAVALAELVARGNAVDEAAPAAVRAISFNVRTASEWARTHGGDAQHRRTWGARRRGVVSTIPTTSKATVVGTQEGLVAQLDDLVGALPGWRRFGEGREGGGDQAGGDENNE